MTDEVRAVLGLGANLADPRAALRAAVAALRGHAGIDVRAVSGLWSTAPVGGPEQADYLNAVVLIATDLGAAALLDVAADLERAAGRVRNQQWGPRTLDVDIIDVAGVTSRDPALLVPHPRAHVRAFVLAPLAQVAPDWVITPVGAPGRPAAAWLAAVADQDVALIDAGEWWR